MEAKEEAIDRISLLPDFILIEILSHLPLRSVVATSVLSQRWSNLWTQLTHLVFELSNLTSEVVPDDWEAYIAIVNRLVPQFTSLKIYSVYICAPYIQITDKNVEACSSSLESWMTTICNRRVEQIELDFGSHTAWGAPIPVPSCMFQCQSLTSLSLRRGVWDYNDGLVFSLPNLKKLDYEHYELEFEWLAKLLKSCPLLEHLSLQINFLDFRESLDLSTICLKKLSIVCVIFNDPNTPRPGKLVINTSKLEDITLRGFCLQNLSFIKPFSALYTANMGLKFGSVEAMDYSSNTLLLLEFTELMSSVSSLCLNFATIKAINNLYDSLVPIIFDNLSELRIEFDGLKDDSWNDSLLFLRCCPNLERLTLTLHQASRQGLKWVEPEYAPSCGLLNLKTIHIQRLHGNASDDRLMQYILSNAKSLKLLSTDLCISFSRKDTLLWREYEFCDRLFRMESCSACDIKFSGQFLTISCPSRGVKNDRPHFQSFRLGSFHVV